MVFQTPKYFGWVKNNHLHKDEFPALEKKHTTTYTYEAYHMCKGKLHRIFGPAFSKINENKYYIDGVQAYNIRQFVDLVTKYTKKKKAYLSPQDLLDLSGEKSRIELQ